MKRIPKSIFLSLLVIILTLNVCTISMAYQVDGDYEYELINNDKNIRITRYIGWGGDIVMPSEIEGKPVTEIGHIDNNYYLFAGKDIKSIVLPKNLNVIGQGVFKELGLVEIDIPNSVTAIGSNAFVNSQLVNVILPKGIVKIRHSAFQGNQLTSITIPNGFPEDGYDGGSYGFAYNKLTSIIIEDGIKSLGTGMFAGNLLTHIDIPNSMTSISTQLFSNNQLTEIDIPHSITIIGSSSFRSNKLKHITIPDSVKTIESEAFAYNQIKSVIIPASVTSMGVDVFKENQSKPEDLIIYGEYGSTAEKYAKHFNHTFLPIDEDIIIPTESIKLNKSQIELLEGEKETLISKITPSNATNKNINWTSSNTNVATVDSTGEVKAMKEGIATITVTTEDGNYSDSCKVVVTEKVEFTQWETKYNVPVDKEWTVDFNLPLDRSTIREKNIYVTDKNGNIVTMLYYQGKGKDNTIYIKSAKDYIKGETYTLWIKNLVAENKEVLKKNIRMDFVIEK